MVESGFKCVRRDPPGPNTERGRNLHLNGNQKWFVYPSGTNVIMRFLDNIRDCEIYTEHQSVTTVAKINSKGYYIASGDDKGQVKVWSADNPEHITKNTYNRLAAVGDQGGRFFLWDSGSSVGEVVGTTKPYLTCDFRNERPFKAVTAGEDHSVQFYNGPPFKFQQIHKCHANYVQACRFSPSGQFLVSVSNDKKIQFYDGKTGELGRAIESAHEGSIINLLWLDENRFLTTSMDRSMKIWDTEGNCLKTIKMQVYPDIKGSTDIEIIQVGFFKLPTSSSIYSFGLDGTLYFWDDIQNPTQEVPTFIIPGHQFSVEALVYDPITKLIISGDNKGVILMRNQQKVFKCGTRHTAQIQSLTINQETSVLASLGSDLSLQLTDIQTNEKLDKMTLAAIPECSSWVGNYILITLANQTVNLYDYNQKAIEILPSIQNATYSFLSRDLTAWIGTSEGDVFLYNIQTKQVIVKLEKLHKTEVQCITVSNDLKYAATVDSQRNLVIYEKASQGEIPYIHLAQNLTFHTSKISALQFNEDNLLASASTDRGIYVWNPQNIAQDKRPQYRLEDTHKGGVRSLTWVNQTIVSGGYDNFIKYWELS